MLVLEYLLPRPPLMHIYKLHTAHPAFYKQTYLPLQWQIDNQLLQRTIENNIPIILAVKHTQITEQLRFFI